MRCFIVLGMITFFVNKGVLMVYMATCQNMSLAIINVHKISMCIVYWGVTMFNKENQILFDRQV